MCNPANQPTKITIIRDDLPKIDTIIIDKEYNGKEPLIKDFLLQIIRKNGQDLVDNDDIQFARIGRKNKAHEKVINTYKGEIKPDILVDCTDVLPYIL